jgi:hypothetical protein
VSARGVCVLALCLVGCVTQPEPGVRVHVTFSNLGATAAHGFDRQALEFAVYFHRASFDAGRVDAGPDEGNEIRRLVEWNSDDPFQFDVTIPAGTYSGTRMEVNAAVACPNGPALLLIASGQNTSPLAVSATTQVSIVAAPVSYTCP